MREDGTINYGKVIRFWRKKVLGWKHADLVVALYNEALQEAHEPGISSRWWQRMEQLNTVPVDEKRRRIIQTLLNIPAAYLGLVALAELAPFLDETKQTVQKKAFPADLREYETRLPRLWRSSDTRKPETLAEVSARIMALQDALLYGSEQQRPQTAWLLCHYLCVCGNVYRYQGYFSDALSFLNKALAVAREKRYEELYAKALYLRGFTHFNRWTNWQRKDNRSDLAAAINDFDAAQQMVNEAAGKKCLFSPSLISAIFADGGRAHSYQVQDKQDRLNALRGIDRAGSIVSASGFQCSDWFLRVDVDWYHIDKAEAFLASGWPGSALDELENVYQGDLQARQRYLYTGLLEAEAYIVKGWGEIGVAHLEEVLVSLSETTSRRHLSHIVNIHQDLLQNETYNRSPAVARLGVKVLKAQHPQLFSK
jgi:tetratricopeptide (TPR) repeat protein